MPRVLGGWAFSYEPCTQAELKIAADESLNKEYLPIQGLQDFRMTIGP